MKQSGVTLLELIVVLAIFGILLVIGMPSFAAYTSNSRLTSATNALVSSLLLARSEAIKRNSRVVLCKSANGLACSISGGWHQGWVVFHDANNNADLDTGEAVVLHQAELSGGVRLTGNAPVSRYVSYAPAGATQMITGAFQAGTLTVCLQFPAQNTGRKVIISSTGRPRMSRAEFASCP